MHKLERKCSQNCDTYINFFKITDNEDPFHMQQYGGENEIICYHSQTCESNVECAKCRGSYSEGEEWLYCPVCSGDLPENLGKLSVYVKFPQ